jgi:hypothetical protein
MLRADALLVLQASNCNEQIPAKLYEYLRAQRPLLAFTDPAGDTAQAVANAGVKRTARLDDADEIAGLLRDFVADPDVRKSLTPVAAAIMAASRKGRAEALAELLNEAALAR